MTMNKRIAYAQVKLPSGKILKRCVIEFDEKGKVVQCYPLTQEMPFTEWRNETFCYPA